MNTQATSSWDPIWEQIFSATAWGKYPGESLIQFVARNFYKSDRATVKILEVGCGPGANIWYLKREGFDVYGIDGSTSAIQQAKERLKSEGVGEAKLMVGDIINLPYEDQFFDAVLDAECLYANNEDNAKRMLAEIKRVLKPGGLFYSRTLSDEISIGDVYDEVGPKSYTNIASGPLKDRGFARLMNVNDIENMYGDFFNIRSIDELKYSLNNRDVRVCEFIVISQNTQ